MGALFCLPWGGGAESVRTERTRVYRIIVETDSTTIASRVSRPKADTTEIVINEQTLMSAYQTVREKVQQRIQQL